MPHDVTLIATLAASLGLALVMGFVAVRLGLPALVGYLLAGVLIGPATPGFVADMKLSAQLAEIGVMLLMFGVGLHFSLDHLMAVRRIAVPGALAQIAIATGLGMLLADYWGWRPGAGLVFGLALSVASTVVLLRALEQRDLLKSVNGSIAVGWLIVEDLAMVLVLVLLPPLAGWLGGMAGADAAGGFDLLATLALTLGEIALFIALMLVLGRRWMPRLLWLVAETGSRELFTLCVIAIAVGIAFGSAKLFGVSFALGAFFAGMVMRESHLSHRAAQESLPFRDAFSVLFFVSVGMLFDPMVLAREPVNVLLVVAIILLGKSLAAFVLVLAFRYPVGTALTVSVSLAQIGEFSFILAGLSVQLGLLPREAQSLLLAGAFISISINPLLFGAIGPIAQRLAENRALARLRARSSDPLAELPASVAAAQVTGHVVLVGYGRVGRGIAQALDRHGVALVVAEQNRELVEGLRAAGIHAVAGDAATPEILIQAHVARARMLVVASPDAAQARRMVEIARALNPGIVVLARTHSEEEAALLRADGLAGVYIGELELAASMARGVLHTLTGQPSESPCPAQP